MLPKSARRTERAMSDRPLRIETSALGGSPLSVLAQEGHAPADWYPARPASPDAWVARVDAVRHTFSAAWLQDLAPALGAAGTAASERLARVVSGRGVVVTTGQQPGLFGGPVYTWSKAISALALADALESTTGIPTAPVFWAATDDSDFAEASYTFLSRTGGADRISIATDAPEGTRMADVPLPAMDALLERLAEACGSLSDSRPLQFARDAYRGPATVGSSYVALLRSVLEPLGITVLDPAHTAVTRAGHSVLTRALHERERVSQALAARAAAMVRAGFEPQVAHVPDLTLVFERRGGLRERVAKARAAVAAATASPGSLSPNVLLRPVVERSILPTVAYVAGPGELAYFAQVSAVAAALDVDAPLAVPRWSCTIIEPHISALLEQYRLEPEDFADPHAVETRLARAAWPARLAAALEQLRSQLGDGLSSVRSALQELDGLAPSATVDGTGRAMEWRIGRLERRITAAVKAREVTLLRDLGTVRGSLWPGGVRQERALNLLPLLARHGLSLLDDMRAAASGHAGSLVGSAAATAIAP
jgi:bacillithiol biosynthesis cysteine-adding enzyme BshC